MTDRTLQKHSDRDSYFLTIAKDLVEQLGWEPRDKINQNLRISGRGAGKLELEKVEEDESE